MYMFTITCTPSIFKNIRNYDLRLAANVNCVTYVNFRLYMKHHILWSILHDSYFTKYVIV